MMNENGRIPLSLEGIEKAVALSRTGDRRAYVESLRKRVAAYERQYKLPSAILHEAIDTNRIDESLDVVEWVQAHEMLVELERERETSLERSGKLPRRGAARR